MPYTVAVLMGGSSFERDFSLSSGRNVLKTLEALGHKVLPLDTGSSLVDTLRNEKPDVAYIALHGGHGEDGTIQSLLEYLEIPFVGSTSSVCRMTWDKTMLPTVVSNYRQASGNAAFAAWPKSVCLSEVSLKSLGAAGALDLIARHLSGGFPYAVLPASGGSAMGISKVMNQSELAPAMLEAFAFDDKVIIEEWIDGTEVAVCVIGEGDEAKALPAVEIQSKIGFFNTEARLDQGFVDFYVPVRSESLLAGSAEGDAEAIRTQIEQAALEVHRAFGCRDLSRVDMIWETSSQTPKVLEVNASPGMSEFSLFPIASQATGTGFAMMLNQLLDTAVNRSN